MSILCANGDEAWGIEEGNNILNSIASYLRRRLHDIKNDSQYIQSNIFILLHIINDFELPNSITIGARGLNIGVFSKGQRVHWAFTRLKCTSLASNGTSTWRSPNLYLKGSFPILQFAQKISFITFIISSYNEVIILVHAFLFVSAYELDELAKSEGIVAFQPLHLENENIHLA